MNDEKIILENSAFKLVLSNCGQAESLICKASGEECLSGEKMSFFTLTELRPYNNEVKLSHPNKRTTYPVKSLTRKGDTLFVDFELTTYKAEISIRISDTYVAFELSKLYTDETVLTMVPRPAAVRLVQLPIKDRDSFGEWLNVSFDDNTAVNVLATSPYAIVDFEKRGDTRILTADALRDVKLEKTSAALIVASKDKLLDAIEDVEEDYDLPRGVKSRRSPATNSSILWTGKIDPTNVDEHIDIAKKAGLELMLIYYMAFINEDAPGYPYGHCGDYDRFRSTYPNGLEDLKDIIKKIRAAGITPGLHILQTHVGVQSHYVTPVADPRLGLVRSFTLSRSLGESDDTIYVEQDPEGCYTAERSRLLKFGGEIVQYGSYTSEPPYCFKDCKRGYFGTYTTEHKKGEIGGQLDVSEFGAASIYIDQNTSIQDDIADDIAKIYSCGFEFIYFDGSEGTNAPYEFHIPNAQYRVYRKLSPAPLFCEGAAKAHFSWHMLSGGNAFDVFPPHQFKEMIAKHPLEQASRMANDLIRVDFGWWGSCAHDEFLMPDMIEYGMSRSAAWDCTVTIMPQHFGDDPRIDDDLEIIRRWESVRRNKLLTREQKELLKDPNTEHILIPGKHCDYEVLPYYRIFNAAGGDKRLSAFVFEYDDLTYVVCWHTLGEGELVLPVGAENIKYLDEVCGNAVELEQRGDETVISVGRRRYIAASLSKERISEIFVKARFE